MDEDPVVAVLPVHISNSLTPDLHLHQFPLLYRPLQVPPSASESGKRIRARYKPQSNKFEIHVPIDTRTEVWNPERGNEYGAARAEEDMHAAGVEKKSKLKEGEEVRLNEVRLSSEEIQPKGDYMLGIIRDGHLHLHSISQIHQFRPCLTYLDVLSRKSRRSRGGPGGDSDSDSDEGPPLDPDDPVSGPPSVVKRQKQPSESREVQVVAKKTSEDKTGGQSFQGGISQIRRDMLIMLRDEAEEPWQELTFCDGEHLDSMNYFENFFSKESPNLTCKTGPTDVLHSITS